MTWFTYGEENKCLGKGRRRFRVTSINWDSCPFVETIDVSKNSKVGIGDKSFYVIDNGYLKSAYFNLQKVEEVE